MLNFNIIGKRGKKMELDDFKQYIIEIIDANVHCRRCGVELIDYVLDDLNNDIEEFYKKLHTSSSDNAGKKQ